MPLHRRVLMAAIPLTLALAACTGPKAAGTGVPDISAVSIAVDPNVATMLWVTWSQDVDGTGASLGYSVDGAEHAIPLAATAGQNRAAIVGIPADTAVDVTLTECASADPGSCDTVTIGGATTGSLPADLVTPVLTSYQADGTAPWTFLLTSVNVGAQSFDGSFYTVILDNLGRVVWYRLTDGRRMTLFPRVAVNGSELLIDETTTFVEGTPGLARVTLDGRKDEETAVPIGFSYSEGEDGSIYFDENETDTQFYLDRLHPDGTLDRIWDCYAWVSAWNTDPYGCGANEVLYDEAHHSVLWSDFGTSTVAEIDAETGELIRYFGETPDGYAIDPSDVHLRLQHSPVWTPTGSLILTTHDPTRLTAQVIREFTIDDATQTATQIWSYQNPSGYYGMEEGDVTRYENGDTLIGYGVAGIIEQIDAESNVLAVLDWDSKLTGHMTAIEDLSPLIGNGRAGE